MELHKKEKRYKEYLRLKVADNENYEAQSNLGYIELEKPRPNGWVIILVPRTDIQNRPNVDDYWEAINISHYSVHIRDLKWLKSKKKKHKDRYHPVIHKISDDQYEKLSPSVKKLFSFHEQTIWHKYYKLNVPNFYWVEKIERRYITHVSVVDEVLLQEEAEIDKKLNFLTDKYGLGAWGCHAPKWFVQPYNRSYRRQSKQKLHNIINHDAEEIFDIPGRHTASWDYW